MPEDPKEQARELAAQIDVHRGLYARGVPELVDADYDALEDELRALLAAHPDVVLTDNPLERPWAPKLVLGQTIRHSRPMLSLEKAAAPEQLDAFCARFSGRAFRVTPKLDGISLAIAFQDGELEYVATRGDGRDGERVTDKAKLVSLGLPHAIDAPGRVEVRGEAVMLDSVWQAYNETHADRPLANPRSGAAGTFVVKSPEACVAEGRTLRFFAFDLDEPDVGDADVSKRLAALGFEVPDVFEAADAEAVRAAIDEIASRRVARAMTSASTARSSAWPRGAPMRRPARRAQLRAARWRGSTRPRSAPPFSGR